MIVEECHVEWIKKEFIEWIPWIQDFKINFCILLLITSVLHLLHINWDLGNKGENGNYSSCIKWILRSNKQSDQGSLEYELKCDNGKGKERKRWEGREVEGRGRGRKVKEKGRKERRN